jgi:glycosyltransferase involved in cell wall biosynthesis
VPQRLKVAIALEATAGGTRKHVRELALGLDPAQFDVHLILSFVRSGEMRADLGALRRAGVSVHEVRIGRRIDPVADARALVRLAAIVSRERFDVVHTQSSKAGFVGRLAAHWAGTPRVFHTPHVWPFQWTRGPSRAAYLRLERLAARWCDGIVCVGREQREIGLAARVAPAEKLVVIENGVAAPPPPTEGERRRARDELALAPGAVCVGMVARLEPQKGVGKYVEAAALVARAHPAARFFLVGSGALESAMRRRARAVGLGPEQFRFLGHRDDVDRLYPGLDLLVLSSLYEGLPYVILEGMAASLPVVATRVSGTEEIVEHGRSGVLVPLGDAGAIAAEIGRLIADRALRERLGARARARVCESFTLERFIARHEALYRCGPAGACARDDRHYDVRT